MVLDAGEVLLHGGVDLLQLPLDPRRHDLLLHHAARTPGCFWRPPRLAGEERKTRKLLFFLGEEEEEEV